MARLGTFDAERWWRPDDLATLPAVSRPGGGADGEVAAMDELLAGFCAPGDLLLTRRPIAPAVRDGLAAAGITFDHHAVDGEAEPFEARVRDDPAARDLITGCAGLAPYAVLPETAALSGTLPPAGTVIEVNSKTWSNTVASELGLPGTGRVVRSVPELAVAVAGTPSAIVKDPFGVSGRGALVVDTPGVLRAIERTLARQVARGKRVELLVQERYPVAVDFSCHFHLEPGGQVRHHGIRTMINRGLRHLGSGPATPELLEILRGTDYLAEIGAVAKALSAAGYHGPVGVDSMLLADEVIVPVIEVNARHSLGLLSLRIEAAIGVPGLHAHLRQLELGVRPGGGIDDLATALAGLRYRGDERPGVILLSGSGLAAPGGRVYLALVAGPDGIGTLNRRVVAAVEAAGMKLNGAVHAA